MKVRQLVDALNKMRPDATVILDKGALEGVGGDEYHIECSVIHDDGREIVLGPWKPGDDWLDGFAEAAIVSRSSAASEYRKCAAVAIVPRWRRRRGG